MEEDFFLKKMKGVKPLKKRYNKIDKTKSVKENKKRNTVLKQTKQTKQTKLTEAHSQLEKKTKSNFNLILDYCKAKALIESGISMKSKSPVTLVCFLFNLRIIFC